MIKFIRRFISGWRGYLEFKKFCNRFTLKQLKEMEESDLKRGIKPIRNRFDYALRNAKRGL